MLTQTGKPNKLRILSQAPPFLDCRNKYNKNENLNLGLILLFKMGMFLTRLICTDKDFIKSVSPLTAPEGDALCYVAYLAYERQMSAKQCLIVPD